MEDRSHFDDEVSEETIEDMIRGSEEGTSYDPALVAKILTFLLGRIEELEDRISDADSAADP